MPFSKCKDAVKSFLVNRLRKKIKMSLPGDGCDRSLYVFGPMRATCDRHSLFACCSIFVKQNVLKTSEALSASTLSRHISKNAGGKTSPLSPVAFWRTLIQHWEGVTLTVITTATCTGLPCRYDDTEPAASASGDQGSKWLYPPFYSGFLFSHYRVGLPWSPGGLKLLSRALCAILKNNSKPRSADCLQSRANAFLTTRYFSLESTGWCRNLYVHFRFVKLLVKSKVWQWIDIHFTLCFVFWHIYINV